MHHDEGKTARKGRVSTNWFGVPSAALLVCSLASSRAHASPPVQTPEEATVPSELDATSPAEPPGEDSTTEAAAPAEPQTAGEWYARGYALGKEGQNEAAAAAFLRSYELQPTSEALYNAAIAHENADAYIEAIATYRRFLAEPEPSPKLVPVAERSIESLLREVGVLKGIRYEQTRPPRELRVDGQVIELDAFPLLLMPGEIEITVVDEAGTSRSERYELLAGESLLVDVRALLPPPPTIDPPGRSDQPTGPDPAELEAAERVRIARTRAQRLRPVSFALVGLTGASAISTLTLGLLANSSQRRFNEATCYEFENNMCPSGFELGDPELHNRNYERFALGTAISASLTGGLALATLVTGLITLHYTRRAKPGERARFELRPSASGLLVRF